MRYITANFIIDEQFKLLSNALLLVQNDGTIQELLSGEKDPEKISSVDKNNIEFFEGVIVPGFVNTHCHLELSYLKNKIQEKTGLPGFVAEVEKNKTKDSEIIRECILNAEKEMIENGIVAVGDISNTNYSLKQKQKENLYYHTFVECYASNKKYADKAFKHATKTVEEFSKLSSDRNRASITPHAPYSVSKELFEKLNHWIKKNNAIVSIHNQESEDENSMFNDGSGKLAKFIQSFGTDAKDFVIGKNSAHSYVNNIPKDQHLQLVHNTYSVADDIQTINNYFTDSYWCFCPNANLYIENKLPQLNLFTKENCKITIGTDSLASNHQLSVLEELKSIQKIYPDTKLTELVQWATWNGAEFLQIEETYGSFKKGKRPGIVLIENVDLENRTLTETSAAKVLA
ncbi:MAG: amidohydrolase family protein [Bacteroidia bacterium]|nr:amidohydrolase family protein [Bacteroidia bacterium]